MQSIILEPSSFVPVFYVSQNLSDDRLPLFQKNFHLPPVEPSDVLFSTVTKFPGKRLNNYAWARRELQLIILPCIQRAATSVIRVHGSPILTQMH